MRIRSDTTDYSRNVAGTLQRFVQYIQRLLQNSSAIHPDTPDILVIFFYAILQQSKEDSFKFKFHRGSLRGSAVLGYLPNISTDFFVPV